ncbi:hypothetical protein ACQQ2N_01200 [Dokdonella sp. MW10]|uniref:hypothetical protein n=1 Tax=Dokdonella sp. MW10 TaxID=2992926 RepID=UPI003F80A5A7
MTIRLLHALGVAILASPFSTAAAVTMAPQGSITRPAGVLPRGVAPTECAIFRDDFELADVLFWHGFDGLGHLQPGSGGGASTTYTTSGGYRIVIDRHTISITDPIARNTVEHWGDPHENLNGKHIKDWGGAPGWDGSQRTILLDDGTKVTMTAAGAQGVTLYTSIYDGTTELQLDNTANRILLHATNATSGSCRERLQHDGETAIFHTDRATGVATYSNRYNEDPSFHRTTFDTPLGSTGGFANPNQVNDYFDDPRLGHT